MTLAALDEGWHILCEKPMALNAAEAIERQAKARAIPPPASRPRQKNS